MLEPILIVMRAYLLFNKSRREKGDMFEYILLKCVSNLKGERTISGIYHLLTGKRSSQTMQDARGYEIEEFFGIYKSLERKSLHFFVNRLEQANLIDIKDSQFPEITESGRIVLETKSDFTCRFNGLKNHKNVAEFEKRFLLLVQTFTNMQSNHKIFLPVVEDPVTQEWVKQLYIRKQKAIPNMVSSLYKEISILLPHCQPIERELFSYRLTGNGLIGHTYDQLAIKKGLYKIDTYLYIQHVFYLFFDSMRRDPDQFPVLSICGEDLETSELITQSAKRTFYYIEKGWTIDNVMTKRRLKKSTIQDHIVEAALVIPDFSIERFLMTDEKNEIIAAADSLQTQRLKQIYQALNGKYSYFQIRLGLAHEQLLEKEGLIYERKST